MSDIDLPVFSFRCNWLEALTERLSFLTSILASEEGAEQRRSMRLTPRRSFDVDILLRGNERTFWDLFVSRLGVSEMMVPLYWEVVAVGSPLVAGVSDRINFDTTSREWDGIGLALLLGKTAFQSEVVEILNIDAAGIDLTSATVGSWPTGTKLLPLRRGILSDVGQPIALTGGIFSVTSRLTLTAPNPWEPAVDASPVYAGLPVFLEEPNWVDPLSISYDRNIVETDNETGKIYRADPAGRVTLGQEHRWFLDGRERLASFRDLVYRHRGRSGGFWLPTFKHDLRLTNSPDAADTDIEIEKVGFDYVGGPASGREHIAIKHTGGTILRKILTVTPGPGATKETLGLDAALGLDLSPGLVRRISFADTARFDQDDFEITHYGGVDALHEVSGRFRTFKNTRTAPAPIEYPIAVSEMSDERCGGPDDDPCYAPPIPPPFEGWYMRVRVEWLLPSTPRPLLGWIMDPQTAGQTYTNLDSPPGMVVEDFVALQFEWDEDVFNANQNFRLQMQFAFDTVSDEMKARLSYKRWNDFVYTVVPPFAGDTPALPGGYFDVYQTFPAEWYFNF